VRGCPCRNAAPFKGLACCDPFASHPVLPFCSAAAIARLMRPSSFA
jgi:hypothetical protein